MPSFDSTVASYVDERLLKLVTSGGVPVVPPQHTFDTGAAKTSIDESHPVYKVSSRLSWGGSAPNANILEGPNAFNTPFIRIVVPYVADAESPITSATFTSTTTCAGCAVPLTDTGSLLRSSQQDSTRVFFDLPISSETIPALSKVTSSPASVKLLITVVDAAGNRAEFDLVPIVTFHILGPPLVIQEDTGYGSASDGRSVYGLKLADGTYKNLWNNSNGGELSRFARYVVYNPYPTSVPIDVSVSGAWQVNEEWDTFTAPLPSNLGCWNDGDWSGCADYDWVEQIYGSGYCEGDVTSVTFPCGAGQDSAKIPYHTTGQGFSQSIGCIAAPTPKAHANAPATLSSGSDTLRSAWVLNNESQAAATAGGRLLAPAATASSAAGLVVYVGRGPFAGARPFSTGWPRYFYFNIPRTGGTAAFWSPDGSFWVKGNGVSHYTCTDSNTTFYDEHYYHASDELRRLTIATEHLSGNLAVNSYSPGPTASTDLGERNPVIAASFDKTINH